VDLRYAFVSQRGYYPHQLRKPNQDAYACQTLCGDPNAYFLGVFDGHGSEGDLCAQFAARRLVASLQMEVATVLKKRKLSNRVAELWDPLAERPRVLDLFRRSFVNTNLLMHAAPFDTQLSGTTAVVCLVLGKTLLVGNCGDSRAILARAHPESPDDQEMVTVP